MRSFFMDEQNSQVLSRNGETLTASTLLQQHVRLSIAELRLRQPKRSFNLEAQLWLLDPFFDFGSVDTDPNDTWLGLSGRRPPYLP